MAEMQGAGHEERLKGRRVLVVEDEVLVALDYCQNLEDEGAEVVGPFQTVYEALNCVRKSRIDVAVLDYALADRNSDTLQSALKSREIPFVVVTAYPRVLVRRSDNQQVLSKPISPNELCESVRAVCR
jgi:DNA-binding response OmpR family regulator